MISAIRDSPTEVMSSTVDITGAATPPVAALASGRTSAVPARGARVALGTDGIGADSVLECVGTQDSVDQALLCARPGGMVGWVGVPHAELDQRHMFWRNVGLRGGVAPVRAYLPRLLDLVLRREIEPGRVFDLELPLEEAAGGYAAMDERRAIKALLRP